MSDDVVDAIRAGRSAVIPTDTVYGLVATPHRSEPVLRMYELKGRPETQPSALMAASLDVLFEVIPELGGRARRIAGELLPGPYTLILANPARRFRWLCGDTPDKIGVRVPALPSPSQEVLDRVGALASTSANLAGGPEPRVLDVGTGTGAIALALAQERPGARVTGLDVSADALALARENAERSGLAVELVQGDLRAGLPGGPYDLVASNPPYVEPDELADLQPEVRDYEPRIALVGERLPEVVARAARAALKPGGVFVMEIHSAHGERCRAFVESLGFLDARITPDLAGRDRVVEGRLP